MSRGVFWGRDGHLLPPSRHTMFVQGRSHDAIVNCDSNLRNYILGDATQYGNLHHANPLKFDRFRSELQPFAFTSQMNLV